ncbi:MAG TPA: hypothetical protein V6D20_25295 [Candidatus Obscuribacterales bacterium]
MSKPTEFWIALVVGALVVIERNREKPLITRIIIAVISAGLGYTLSADAADHFGRSETFWAVVITSFGHLVFDLIASIFSDREFIIESIRGFLGRKK